MNKLYEFAIKTAEYQKLTAQEKADLLTEVERLENNSLVKSLNQANKKYLKVLDILKDKIFVERFNNNEFGLVIDSYCTNATTITKEEYDILKEVLEASN